MIMSTFTKIASTVLLLGFFPVAIAITIQYTDYPEDPDSSVGLKVFCPDEKTTVDGRGNKHGESCWQADDKGTATTFYDNITLYNKGAITLPIHRCILKEGVTNQNYVCVRAKQGTEFTTTNPLKESNCTISFEGIGSIGKGKVTAATQCECKADTCKNGSGYVTPLYSGPTITAPPGSAIRITTNDTGGTCKSNPNYTTLLNYLISGSSSYSGVEVETHLSEDYRNMDKSLCIYYGNIVGGRFWNDEGCKITITSILTGRNDFNFQGCRT